MGDVKEGRMDRQELAFEDFIDQDGKVHGGHTCVLQVACG